MSDGKPITTSPRLPDDRYAAIGYWGVGLPLAFHFGLHGAGIWIGLASGLAVVAALLLARWLRRDRLAPQLVFEH
jgi:MATE family multidrug resistance protein